MAKETKIGQLVIDLQIKTQALEKGLETAKKKLQEIEKQDDQVGDSNKRLETTYIALAATAVASLIKIKSALDDSVTEYTKYKNSMMTVNKVAQNTGTTLSEVQEIIDKSNEFKLMNESDLNASIKNLLLYGYTAEQVTDILKRLQDSAVGNRQECYSLSEAVRVTTEGIRMENSVTSDAAGVQKNIAKMYEEHAKTLGKTTNSLTQAEKAQAVYNGIMKETEPVVGSAAQIASQYEGVEAQKNAELLKTQQLIGESLIPTYNELTKVQQKVLSGLNDMIKSNKAGTAGFTTFITALTAGTVAVTAVTKGIAAYKAAAVAADMTTKAFTISLMANPLFIGTLAISVGLAALNAFNTAMQESIDKLNEITAKSQNVSDLMHSFMENSGFEESQVTEVENIKQETEEIIKSYEERKEKVEELKKQIEKIESKSDYDTSMKEYNELADLKKQLSAATRELDKYTKKNELSEDVVNAYKKRIDLLNQSLEMNADKQQYTTLTNLKATKQQLIDIAQTKEDINGKRQLLDILKKGKTSTDEYSNAKSQLAKVYPELANVNENTISSTEALINSEEKAANAEWALAQSTILNSIAELQAMQTNDAKVQNIAILTKQKVDDVRASIEAATMSLVELTKLNPEDFKSSVTTNFTPKTSRSSTKTYSNKALDNYKKQIEHKKAMDQISLREEISMYQTALQKYAKTTDEKRELMEKIYSLQKELQNKTLDDYISEIEYKKSLDQLSLKDEIAMYQTALQKYAKTAEDRRELTTTIYELQKEFQEEELNNYIEFVEHKKALDQKSLEEEINDYEWAYNHLAVTTEQKEDLEERLYSLRKELAQKNKDLLDQQTKDYEDYIEEQKQLRGAEYDVKEQENDLNKIIELHRNYLDQIMKDERLSLDERKELYQEELDTIKSYEEQKRDLRVQSVDDTVSQLTNAITKQLEEMEEADKKAIEENIDLVEKWKDARISAINEEYDARIEAIQKELDLLDESEEEKTRAEEDAEYERKKNRLEELVAFEHDATTKANYQQELDKLIAEYQKTLDKRALEDKKESLKEQQELIKEEQNSKIEAIEEEADKQKEVYENQLDELEKYYEKQKDLAQETAEKMLLNVEQNQKQILNLLNSYGDAYEITGQSLGEKLAQGINNGIADKIQNMIQKLQDTIDAGIERKIKEWTSGNYEYEAGANKPQTKTINVYQTNNIEQTPEMPSETYRKMKNINEQLAAELAGL